MTEPDKARVLIIDGMNMFIRAYMADPSVDSNGEHIGAVTGFIKMLQKYCREVCPSLVFIAWDGAGGSKKRKELNPNYKSGRKPIRLNRNIELPIDMENKMKYKQQMDLVDVLDLLPVYQIILDDIEADDLIAYLCNKFICEDYNKFIVSNDKDFLQLLDDCTFLFRPAEKDELYWHGLVVEKYGIHPNNFALARSICGDSSDNIDGVAGAGLPTIAKRFPFLANDEVHSLDQILDKCREMGTKYKVITAILENESKIRDNYNIMQLYSPSLSYESTKELNRFVDETNLSFDKKQFELLLNKKGIFGLSLQSLYSSMEDIVRNKLNVKRT